MSAAFTPGPWFTHREGFSTVYVEARIGGGLIQEVAACGPTAAGQEQQQANARLIAAAPDLLAALEGIFGHYAAYVCNCGEPECKTSIARAAIAKATGEAA